MYRLLDVLASGVHDAKNELFFAESQIAAAEAAHGIDLSEARYAIEDAAGRLSRTLSAYHLLRKDATLSVVPSVVDDLCAEVALDQKKHLAHAGIDLEIECSVRDEWPIDRDLITDVLNNAVQNAGRHARSKVRLKAWNDEATLFFRVEDDGPGFSESSSGVKRGTGLIVAERIASLHKRGGRHGSLHLLNGGELGGGFFEMHLP
jgi:signal transduction histidine kinase